MNSPISLSCISEYTPVVSDEKILSFLKLIFYERKNIKQAAKYYDIKYITAKKLVRQFQHNRLIIDKKYQQEYKALFAFVQKKNKNHQMIQSIHYDKFIGNNTTNISSSQNSCSSLLEKEREVSLKIGYISGMLIELRNEIMQNQELITLMEIKLQGIVELYMKKQMITLNKARSTVYEMNE